MAIAACNVSPKAWQVATGRERLPIADCEQAVINHQTHPAIRKLFTVS